MTSEEQQVAALHNLDAEQMQWRRNKISQLGSVEYFRREFPLTPDEAFLASQFDSFITSDLVMAARKTTDIEPYGPLLIGCDPAGQGDDATAIAWRQGHCIVKIEKRHKLSTMEIAGWLANIIREEKPARVSIDVGGLGIGIYERLMEQGYDGSLVTAVNFGNKPIEPAPLDEMGRLVAVLLIDAPSCGRTCETRCRDVSASLTTMRCTPTSRHAVTSTTAAAGWCWSGSEREKAGHAFTGCRGRDGLVRQRTRWQPIPA